MKALWDPQVFTWQVHGGISRLFVELYRELAAEDLEVQVIVPRWIGPNAYAAEIGLPQTLLNPRRRFPGRKPIVRFFNRSSFRRALRMTSPVLVHPTYFDPAFLDAIGNTPFVLTVFDMVHERFSGSGLPFDRQTIARKKALLDRAARIIAISESTKRDLIELAGIAAERIDVAHPANCLIPPPAVLEPAARAASPARSNPYLLFVGQRPSYKNFATCLRGVADLLIERDLMLRCIGGGPFTDEERALISLRQVDDRVTQETLTDEALALAYRDAELFLFPSLGEGFGIPLLEAFSCACPVAASDIAVFREVAGQGAQYFDPREPDSIRAAAIALLDDSALRARLVATGRERLGLFSWARCARETAGSYQRVAEAGGR